jgi:pyruvate/2-oxoglutarate/acetoin dehydrogenase E1 component
MLALALQQDAHTGLDAHTGRDAVGRVAALRHLLERVKATGRVLLVQAASRTAGFMAESRPGSPSRTPSTTSQRRSASRRRSAGPAASARPSPYSPDLEKVPVPQVPDIVRVAAS